MREDGVVRELVCSLSEGAVVRAVLNGYEVARVVARVPARALRRAARRAACVGAITQRFA